MPDDGQGNFELVPEYNPVVPNTIIQSDWANNTLDDIAAGLTNRITRDGNSPPLADIPWGNNKITNLKAGVLKNDAINVEQYQKGSLNILSSVVATGTTSTAITGNLNPAITAYTVGQQVHFIMPANNEGATTLNINSLGVKSIKKHSGEELLADSLIANGLVVVAYNGVFWELLSDFVENPTTPKFLDIKGSPNFVMTVGDGLLRGRVVQGNTGSYAFDDTNNRYGIVFPQDAIYIINFTLNIDPVAFTGDNAIAVELISRKAGSDTSFQVYSATYFLFATETIVGSFIKNLSAGETIFIRYKAVGAGGTTSFRLNNWSLTALMQENYIEQGSAAGSDIASVSSNLMLVSSNLASVSSALGSGGGGALAPISSNLSDVSGNLSLVSGNLINLSSTLSSVSSSIIITNSILSAVSSTVASGSSYTTVAQEFDDFNYVQTWGYAGSGFFGCDVFDSGTINPTAMSQLQSSLLVRQGIGLFVSNGSNGSDIGVCNRRCFMIGADVEVEFAYMSAGGSDRIVLGLADIGGDASNIYGGGNIYNNTGIFIRGDTSLSSTLQFFSCHGGSVQNLTSTTVLYSANTWYKFKLKSTNNGLTWELFVDNVSAATFTVVPAGTGNQVFPKNPRMFTYSLMATLLKSTFLSSTTVGLIDYFKIKQVVSR